MIASINKHPDFIDKMTPILNEIKIQLKYFYLTDLKL